jgi:hypothetical protein
MTESSRVEWYWRMLAPFAVLPLLSLRALAIAAPMIAVNVLTLYPYTRDYRFHYSAIVVAGCAVATVEGIAWLQRTLGGSNVVRNVAVGSVVAASFLTTIAWGASPLARDYQSIWPLDPSPNRPFQELAVALVPDDASVSAAYNVVPHMTHRVQVYEFPVPWCNVNWGVDGENLDDPADVEWLVLDRRILGNSSALAADLLETEFTVRYEGGDIVVAERTQPAPLRTRPLADGACDLR